MEYIGNVRINDDDYPGKDLYSDGEVEDVLLEIAKNTGSEEISRVIKEKKSWAVLYHFSPVRENILNWYPIEKTDKVLEIGSGCGALTGALARRAQEVTCVELSKKRSYVNAYRHRDLDNIEIRLGNFQTVEPSLPDQYDLITLIGVFEYAASYIDSPDPYADFLKQIARHLGKGGRILLAIENRLGMKYFAGCTEDHTGRFFDGIEGYPSGGSARTFSRPALEKLFLLAGFSDWEFYYPYPDYKLPMTVYSDQRLPEKGELRQNQNNFDRQRMVLFDEARAFDAVIEEGLFPLFSNSYFVVLHGGAS
jgi:SAM-dependent methyltransferase